MATSLLELQILDGPNLYFPHAAVKLTLDVTPWVDATEDEAARLASGLGLRNAAPGPPATGFRQRFAGRALARLVRQVATEAGTHRLPVRVRPARDVHRLVVAYPWRHRSRAEALGRAVAEVLDAGRWADVDRLLEQAATRVRDADLGPGPRAPRPRIPVVAVTGSRGKTSTCRLLTRMGRAAGRCVGWSTTDGLYVDGERVHVADHSGPSGAARLLARPEVDLAVAETGPHGILLGGIGVTHNDVSVVTNVIDAADGSGRLPEADTADQLAEVKAVVARITRSDGWCVLNADDPRVWAMRAVSPARPWAFSQDPHAPALQEVLDAGGRVCTVIDDWVCVLEAGHDPVPLVCLADLAPADAYTVPNALAAAAAGLAVGLPREAVVAGLVGP